MAAKPFVVPPEHLALLRDLVYRLRDTPRLSAADAEKLRRKVTARRATKILAKAGPEEGSARAIDLSDSRPHLKILDLPASALKDEMARIRWKLGAQVAIVDEALNYWFDAGELVPSFYPEQISVILQKAKSAAWERAFLAVFGHHLAAEHAMTYSSLIDRPKC